MCTILIVCTTESPRRSGQHQTNDPATIVVVAVRDDSVTIVTLTATLQLVMSSLVPTTQAVLPSPRDCPILQSSKGCQPRPARAYSRATPKISATLWAAPGNCSSFPPSDQPSLGSPPSRLILGNLGEAVASWEGPKEAPQKGS